MIINVDITRNGTSLKDYLVSYTRDADLCSGVTTLDITFTKNLPVSISEWDKLILYESGNKKGEFYVTTIERNEKGTIEIKSQDASLKLIDYFITDNYIIDYPSFARSWIVQFLTEAGVSYQFTVPSLGSPISENTSLGLNSAYDTILQLLQQSGWFMYFNKDGKAIIGKIDKNPSSYKLKLTDSEILSLKLLKNDSVLRNRAVVWGNYDQFNQQQVFTDISKITPWNYDANDKRAVVLSNTGIKTVAVANQLATQMLNEFTSLLHTKTVELHGAYNLFIGDSVFVSSKYWNGVGLITSLVSTMSSSGLETTLTLDERCPRLFGYFSVDDDYVYVGTSGAGIWRKPLTDTGTWTNYSQGITTSGILDLRVNNGVLATVTFSGDLYTRNITQSQWFYYPPGLLYDFEGNPYASGVVAKACSINRISGEILAAYSIGNSTINAHSWLLKIPPSGIPNQVYITTQSGVSERLLVLDVDTTGHNNIVTVLKRGTYVNYNPYLTAYGDDLFTTLDKEEPTGVMKSSEFGQPWYTYQSELFCTPLVYDNALYTIENKFEEPNLIRMWIVDFSTGTANVTTGNWHDLGAYYAPENLFFYDENNIWLIISSSVYSYNISTDTFSFEHVPATITYTGTAIAFVQYKIGRMLLYWRVVSTGETVFYAKCQDIVTNTISSEVEIGRIDTYENMSITFQENTEGQGSISAVASCLGYDNRLSTDNLFDGQGSYYEPAIPKLWLVSATLDIYNQEIYGDVSLVHPNSALESTDSNATTDTTIGNIEIFEGVSNYTYPAFPKLHVEFEVHDGGQWIPNPDYPGIGQSPYIHLGYRIGDPDQDATYDRGFSFEYGTNGIVPGKLIADDISAVGLDSQGTIWMNPDSVGKEILLRPLNLVGADRIGLFIDPDGSAYSEKGVGPTLQPSHFKKFDYLYGYFFTFGTVVYSPTAWYLGMKAYDVPNATWNGSPSPVGDMDVKRTYSFNEFYNPTNPYLSIIITKTFAGETIAFVEYRFSHSITGDIWRNFAVMWFGDIGSLETNVFSTLKEEPSGVFTVIDTTTKAHEVDIAQFYPITTFQYDYQGIQPPDNLRMATSGVGFSSQPPLNTIKNIGDIRTFFLEFKTPFVTQSGTFIPSGVVYLGATSNSSIRISDVTFSGGWHVLTTISGHVLDQLETTNYSYPPYFFVSTASGITMSGQYKFYQRNPEFTQFFDYTGNLPNSKITVIRVDDAI